MVSVPSSVGRGDCRRSCASPGALRAPGRAMSGTRLSGERVRGEEVVGQQRGIQLRFVGGQHRLVVGGWPLEYGDQQRSGPVFAGTRGRCSCNEHRPPVHEILVLAGRIDEGAQRRANRDRACSASDYFFDVERERRPVSGGCDCRRRCCRGMLHAGEAVRHEPVPPDVCGRLGQGVRRQSLRRCRPPLMMGAAAGT